MNRHCAGEHMLLTAIATISREPTMHVKAVFHQEESNGDVADCKMAAR